MSGSVKKIAIPVLTVVLLILMVVWMAGTFDDRVAPGLSEPQGTSNSDVFTVTTVESELYEPVAATLWAKQGTVISSRIMARITSIHVRSGDTVSKGQLLIDLERSDLESRESQAAEQVKSISARAKEAKSNLNRAVTLQKDGLIAIADVDKARANNDALSADLATARKALQEAGTAVSFSEIRSPIDGRVVDRFAEPGDTVSPGGKLLSVYNPLTLRVEARVREQLALGLQIGQQLEVEIPAFNKNVSAVIEELVPAADPGSRSFLIKASIDFDSALLPGMYARLQVPAGRSQRVMVPQKLIAQVGQLDMVWVAGKNGPQARYVRIGKSDGAGMVEVISGLKDGEKLLPIPSV
ncbi:MAG: efflux RND transporter periplasmic adaptor subunit [Pseudomonadales bacterium]